MFKLIALITTISLVSSALAAQNTPLPTIEGDWQLRVMDGYDVRKVRAILEFIPKKMHIAGFDACNRISGTLTQQPDGNYTSLVRATRMACRGQSFIFVSTRLHEALKGPFRLIPEKRYGIEGLTLKSRSHDLFFKRLGKQ